MEAVSDNAYTRATSLYAQWDRGELQAEGLEAKARIILGWGRRHTGAADGRRA